MKTGYVCVAMVACLLVMSTVAHADKAAVVKPSKGLILAETNLLLALECEMCGVKESAAFTLGDLKCDRAVIPLMRMLKNAELENHRIIAALSLCKIGDARGVFAVKQAVRFDDSERVRRACAWFYNEYVQPGTFRFVAKG